MDRLDMVCLKGERPFEFSELSDEDFCLRLREMYGEGSPIGNMSARNIMLVDSAKVYPNTGFRKNFFISFRRELEIRDDDFLMCTVDMNPDIIHGLLLRMKNLDNIYVVGKKALESIFDVAIKPGTEYPVEAETYIEQRDSVKKVHIYPSYCTWVRKRGMRV